MRTPEEQKRERWVRITVLVMGGLLAIASWLLVDRYNQSQEELAFKREARSRAVAIQEGIHDLERALVTLKTYQEVHPEATVQQFAAFSSRLLKETPGLQGLYRARRIPSDTQARFEFTSGGQLLTWQADSGIAPLQGSHTDREFLYPLEVSIVREEGLPTGLDIYSIPEIANLISEFSTGESQVVSGPRQSRVSERYLDYDYFALTGSLNGATVILGAVNIGELVRHSLSLLAPVGIRLSMTDITLSNHEDVLFAYNDNLQTIADLKQFREPVPETNRLIEGLIETWPVKFGNRQWLIYLEPGLGYQGVLPTLKSGLVSVFVMAVALLLYAYLRVMARRSDYLARMTYIDGVTGIGNRTLFERSLLREWNRAIRHHDSVAVILVDIDNFGRYNARVGPVQADECLRHVARRIAELPSRAADVVARYEGDTFAVLLPETEQEGALHLAYRICSLIEAMMIPDPDNPAGSITVSAGVCAHVPEYSDGISLFMDRVNQALELARNSGRNCAMVAASRERHEGTLSEKPEADTTASD